MNVEWRYRRKGSSREKTEWTGATFVIHEIRGIKPKDGNIQFARNGGFRIPEHWVMEGVFSRELLVVFHQPFDFWISLVLRHSDLIREKALIDRFFLS